MQPSAIKTAAVKAKLHLDMVAQIDKLFLHTLAASKSFHPS